MLSTILLFIIKWTAKPLDFLHLNILINFLFRFNTRPLSQLELQEAQKVFRMTLPYHKIRISENASIAKWTAKWQNCAGMGICICHTINFSRPLNTLEGNSDMIWLIHELTHIAQMEQVGIRYMAEALYAQCTDGYDYTQYPQFKNKQFHQFNREQQADIIAHYYQYVLYGNTSNTVFYQAMQQQLLQGAL